MGADFDRRSGVLANAHRVGDRRGGPPEPTVSTHSHAGGCYVAEVSDGSVTGFHHLALTVRDLDASTSWYEQLFDLDPMIDEPGDERRAKVYRLRGTAQLFGLVEHRGNDGAGFRPDRTGLDHSGRIDIPLGAILNFADPDGIALSIFYEGD